MNKNQKMNLVLNVSIYELTCMLLVITFTHFLPEQNLPGLIFS